MSEPRSVSFSGSGPPETVLDPEPPDTVAALDDALAQAPADRRDAMRRSSRAGHGSSTVGRASVSTRKTMSTRTPRSASATTADSTACVRTAGAGRATSVGLIQRTAGSCGRSRVCNGSPLRSANRTKPNVLAVPPPTRSGLAADQTSHQVASRAREVRSAGGAAKCWGANTSGQLGLQRPVLFLTPVDVIRL